MACERFVIGDGDELACAVTANDGIRAPERGGSFGGLGAGRLEFVHVHVGRIEAGARRLRTDAGNEWCILAAGGPRGP